MKFKLFMFTVLLAVVLAFVFQNSVPVAVRFFTWEYTLPFALLLLAVLAVGVLLGMLLVLRRQSYNKKKKAAKEAAQQEPPAATATLTDEAGNTDQDRFAKPLAQDITVATGEHHESDHTDHRGDGRVW